MTELLSLTKKSTVNFFKSPVLIFLGLIFFLFLFGFSKLGGYLAPSFQTSFSNYAWVGVSILIFLLVGGLVSTLLIYFSQKSITKKEKSIGTAIKHSWLRSSLVLFTFLIFFNILNLILLFFTKLMLLIKPHFSISVEAFRILSILVSFLFVAGVIIFFSFTGFFIVLHDLSFFAGIKRSINFVKKEYINTLLLTVVFYAIISLVYKLHNVYADLFNYAIILPFTFFLLTKLVLEFEK